LRKIGCLIVISLILTAILSPIFASPQEYTTLETKYFVVRAPPEKMRIVDPELMDRIYETFLSFTGVVPRSKTGEIKISVVYDEKTPMSWACAGCSPMRIYLHPAEWERKEQFYSTFSHELGHIFTMGIKNWFFICPVRYEWFDGIVEGWAIFLDYEVEKVCKMSQRYTWYQSHYLSIMTELQEYEEKGWGLEGLKKDPDPWMGILYTLVEKYGWDSLKKFFQFVANAEIPEWLLFDDFSAFVWAWYVVTGDVEVYSMFRDRWHIPIKYGFFLVNISVSGFEGNYTLQVDKENMVLNKENLYLFLPNDSSHLISISPKTVSISDKERLICKDYSFRIQNSTKITFEYTKQYYLKIEGWWGNWYDAGEEAKISVPDIIYFGNGTRNLFAGFFDEKGNLISKENSTTIKMDSPKTLQVKWEKEYLLQMKSEYGAINGSGWYKAGTETKVSITQAIIDYGNSTRRVFSGWYENEKLLAKEPNLSVLVNGPKTIIAKWETEYEVKVINKEGTESNWYKKGEKVTVSVPSTVVYEGIYVWHFRGWEVKGKIVSTSPQHSFEVEEPLTIKTVWEKELNSSLITLIILAAILVLSAIVLPKKMHLK
jgi:hypothetical protein